MTVYIKDNGIKKYFIGGQAVPQVGDLFIDKLFITLKVPIELRQKTVDGFLEAINDGWVMNDKDKVKSPYIHNVKLSMDDLQKEGKVLIQCDPKNPMHNFFRIEFNPSNVDLDYVKTCIDLILPGGYSNLMTNGVVNRIDFTVDTSYLDATEIIAEYPKMKVEKHIGKGGKTESKYLGAPSSSKQIAIYDKTAEIAQKNKKKAVGQKKPVPTDKLLRIEIRYMKTGCTIKAIEGIKNPFQNLTLIAFPGALSAKTYDPTWTLFLRVCDNEGIASALAHFNLEDREKFIKRLDTEGRKDWWKPEQIWQGLPAAIKKITDVQGYGPKIQTV
jgi:hypothetical protein